MKKPHVLNRSMFNQGGTSAYGRGITSNLVSDEQRIKYNSGGRVGFGTGGDELTYTPWKDVWSDYIKPGFESWSEASKAAWGMPGLYKQGDVIGQNDEGEDVIFNDPLWEAKSKRVRKDAAEERLQKERELSPGHPSQFEEVEEIKKSQILPPEPRVLPTDPESDELGAGDEWETFAEKLYDKKGAKGKAQLELAGNVLAAAFQPKKEAMAILGKGVGQFGKTASERKEKMEDIAATGKMYDIIHKGKATEKGRQDRLTAAAQLESTDTPENLFWGHLDAAKQKGNLKDKDYAYAYERATKSPTQIIKKEEDKAAIEANPEQFKDTIFVMGTSYLKLDKAGKLQDITKEVLESFKG